MLKHLRSAFQWNAKWFFGSSGTVIATFWGAQTVADRVFDYKLSNFGSFSIAVLVLLIAITARLIFVLNNEIVQLSAAASQRQREIDKFISEQSRRPYNRSRGDFHIYGIDIQLLKEAFSYINALRKEEEITVRKLSVALNYLCEKLKEVFEAGVDKKYAVSLKLIEKVGLSDSDFRVKVFCCDSTSREPRDSHYHKTCILSHNSCFTHSTHEAPNFKSFYYINNDVTKDASYKSSFLEWYPFPDGTTFEQRESNWTLPYRSELVVPIFPTLSRNLPFDRKDDVLGFLCIDCKQTGGFHPVYDPDMLAGVSDGIYDLVARLVKELDARTSTQ